MRSAGNFGPEWGYLAPAPSFMRTARVILVATAVGATAGAAVVLSLVDRPVAEANRTPFAARAIVTSVQAAPAVAVAPSPAAPIAAIAVPKVAAPVKEKASAEAAAKPQVSTALPAPVAPQPDADAPAKAAEPLVTMPPAVTASVPAGSAAVSPQASTSVPGTAAGIAALSAAPTAAPDSVTSDAPDLTITAPEPLPPQKKVKQAAKPKSQPGLGSVLKRLFNASANRQSVH